MENCRRRQSSSISVLLPTVAFTAPSVSEGERLIAVQQESIPWQSFVVDAARSSTIRNTTLGPL
jgi:hypothetical protein